MTAPIIILILQSIVAIWLVWIAIDINWEIMYFDAAFEKVARSRW